MSPEQEAAMVAQVGIQTLTHPDAVAVSVCYSTNAEVQLFSLRMRFASTAGRCSVVGGSDHRPLGGFLATDLHGGACRR